MSKKNLLLGCLMASVSILSLKAHEVTLHKLETKIDSILTAKNVHACQAAIFTADRLIWKGSFGVTDIETDQMVTDKNLFRVGSITKSFVAVAVMQLVEQGKLDLNDKVRVLVPEITFENKWEETDPVRVVHLLEHTTGWDDISLKEYAASGDGLTLFEGLEYVPRSRTCRYKPGTYMNYCNSGPAVAAYIVEKITGQDFETYLQENILDPLGMSTTSILHDKPTKELLVKTYLEDRETDYWHILFRPAGSMNSNATELSRFVQMLMNGGVLDTSRILTASSVARMEKTMTTYSSHAGNHNGYGLHLYTTNYDGFNFYGHSGGLAGALAIYIYNTQLNAGAVAMINASNMDAAISIEKTLIDFFTHELTKNPLNTSTQFNEEYLGTYRTANTRMQFSYPFERIMSFFSVYMEEDKYYSKSAFAEPEELIPGGVNILFKKNEEGFYDEYVFTKDDAGNYIVSQVQVGWGNYIKKSGFTIWFYYIWFLFCLVLALSSLVFGLIWMIVHSVKYFRQKENRNTCLKLPHFLSAAFLVASTLMFAMLPMDKLFMWMGHPTVYSITVYAFGILFFLFAFLALYRAVTLFKGKKYKVLKIYALVVSLALVDLAIYLAWWGLIFTPSWV